MRKSDWWRPDRHQDRRPFLLARNAIHHALRRWFDDKGFIEVDPAILQKSPGNELHLHAFRTERLTVHGTRRDVLCLHTSPEFAMKKLLAAGETKIFAFTHAFRNREDGPLHASEFTMLEWYRAGATLEDLMTDCEALMATALQASGRMHLQYKMAKAGTTGERISVDEAFKSAAGVDILASLDNPNRPDAEALRRQTNLRTAPDDTWSDIFTRILVEQVEPALDPERATFLYDYPRPEAALARAHPEDPRLARRFELYACGVELANAFEELTDANEQRARFEADMNAKQALYGERYPIDEGLLRAIAQMPPTAGIALGFDRLTMLATGADRIDQVQWTPPGG